MPAIIGGAIKVIAVVDGATVQFGDTGVITPSNTIKSNHGSGGFSTGDYARSINALDNIETLDVDVFDHNTNTTF